MWRKFAKLVAAPPGFKLEGDDEFMFAFHAAVDPQNHTLLAFAHKEWPALIQQYLTFPRRAARAPSRSSSWRTQ